MGSYTEEQRLLRYHEEHKKEYEYRLVGVKKVFNIPVVFIKQNQHNSRKYLLFNKITLLEKYSAEGFKNA